MTKTTQTEEFDRITGLLRGEYISSPPPNTPHFLQLVQDHRLISRVASHLHIIQDDNLREFIQASSLANKIYQLKLVSVLHDIHKMMGENPFIVLKGPVLSQFLYNDPAERTSRDLDILIEKQKFQKVLDLFLDANYQLLTPFNTEKQKAAILKHMHHVELLHPSGEVLVELHWNLTAMKSIEVNISDLMQKTKAIKIGEIDYHTLNTFDQLAYLAVHGTFHVFTRLQWLCDINDLHKQLSKEEELALMNYLENEGLINFYLVAMKLINDIFKTDIHPQWMQKFENSQASVALVKIAHEQMRENDTFQHGPEIQSGLDYSIQHHLIQYHAGGFKGLIKSLIARNVRPNNWEFYVFPDKVFGLNHIFSRFIWLIRKVFSRRS